MALRKATKEEIKYAKSARDTAKTIRYAVLYGAGKPTVSQAIKGGDPTMRESECGSRAETALRYMKGTKDEDGLWQGGTDSAAFNAMEYVASQKFPQLPVLGTRISAALRPTVVGNDFSTCRNNFSIQALGGEFLDIFLTAIHWAAYHYGIVFQFVVSIHDNNLDCCV